MATYSLLLGPPEIHAQSTIATVDQEGDMEMGNAEWPKTNVLKVLFNNPRDKQFGYTENNSRTYMATWNPCLDFFFCVLPSTPSDVIIKKVQKAWAYDPLTTLKLICHLRGLRGTGKGARERFYTTALWLHKWHPITLALNVRVFTEFGYFKDLLEILYRVLEGETVRQSQKAEWNARKASKEEKKKIKEEENKKKRRDKTVNKNEKNTIPKLSRDLRIKLNTEMMKIDSDLARKLREVQDLTKAKKAYVRYQFDPFFRFLHECVSDMFAEALKSDIRSLNAGGKISLAAKWCPKINSSYDKSLLICESIARRVFPRDSDPEYQGMEEAHYAYRVRDRLRKQVLVPLHKALQLPEVYMSAKEWESLPYDRVASVAMKNYKKLFLRHDNKRFHEYLDNVKRSAAEIAEDTLLPHQIIESLGDSDGGEMAELQWKRMVDDMSNEGKLHNCIAVCDVSGNMTGEPLDVCVALGLMVSELSEEPWKGKVITFNRSPKLHRIEGESLVEKAKSIRQMDNYEDHYTDFQKLFDLILNVAVQGELRERQMINKVYVFSKVEFDQASRQRCTEYGGWGSGLYEEWETYYEVIQSKFQAKGFNNVPEIVFWNLRNSTAVPPLVPSDKSGVVQVSGFCKKLLEIFLDNGGIINPDIVMEHAISTELYQKLVVHD